MYEAEQPASELESLYYYGQLASELESLRLYHDSVHEQILQALRPHHNNSQSFPSTLFKTGYLDGDHIHAKTGAGSSYSMTGESVNLNDGTTLHYGAN